MTLLPRRRLVVCLVPSLLILAFSTARSESATAVTIAVGRQATTPERMAAKELADHLTRLYCGTDFEIGAPGDTKGPAIFLGTPKSAPRLFAKLGDRSPDEPESYVVTTDKINGEDCGLILGADPSGVVYGVYGLLRHLGVGFYLSGDTIPERKDVRFSFSEWDLSDRPLVPTRLVFNWHNFLSGCSTWDVEHWQQWIIQSQKMGYNGVMVHAYGNNPMAGFAFRGVQKPVGYLSSTRVGRDWSTNHVNDARRLFGGEVFDAPVFGCEAAVEGSDLQRTEAAQSLMGDAFVTAEERGVDVYFAVDVDTTSANPQELIELLPEGARFEVTVKAARWMGQGAGKMLLVNPETPEGYAFYRAQVRQLLDVYPQIDCLVVWHRKNGTPWMEFTLESMPKAWQEEFAAEVARTPGAEDLYHAHHLFAQAKIVAAFQRAVKELNRGDVEIAFGSWDFHFLPAAHRFMPKGVALIPLDWSVLRDDSVFDTKERRLAVAEVGATRPVIPIAWAHHDDGNYLGRPYTPFSNFCDRLTEMKCQSAGYGVIHWTTKPLDLYFQSLVNQIWQSSKNEPLKATCQRMARQLIGPGQAEAFAGYLEAWVTTMPKIGRETTDFFIDHALEDLREVEGTQRRRLKMLQGIDRSQLDSCGNEWLDYFEGLEEYVLAVHSTEDVFNRAKKSYSNGDIDAARSIMATCHPEKVIEQFAEFSQHGGLTRGEEGVVVTMNTRWLPHYVRFRQMLAVDSVRYNFAPTSHDLLAQMRGVFTFYFDSHGDVWQCLGAEETGVQEFSRLAHKVPANSNAMDAIHNEICRTGIESDQPITLTIQPILSVKGHKRLKPEHLLPGGYELTLLGVGPTEAAADDSLFELRLSAGDEQLAADRVNASAVTDGGHPILTRSYPIELASPATLELTLTPLKDKVRICGVVLTPAGRSDAYPRGRQ